MPKEEYGGAVEIRGFWRAIKYFLITFLIGVLVGWIPTRVLNLDLIILTAMWEFLIVAHWYITIPTLAIFTIILVYVNKPRKKKKTTLEVKQ